MFLTRTSLIDIYAIIQAKNLNKVIFAAVILSRHILRKRQFYQACLKKHDSLMVKKTKLFALSKS